MRTIGLLHGMGSPSTTEFYSRVNDRVNEIRGGAGRAEMLISSIDFGLVADAIDRADWDLFRKMLTSRAKKLEAAGADFLVIGSNTGHIAADAIQAATDLPLLHIADSIAAAANGLGAKRLAVLGTKPTMEESFYVEPLRAAGFDVLIPEEADRVELNRLILEELTLDVFTDDARTWFLDLADRMAARGADAVVMGCTEFGLLVQQALPASGVPLIDSETVHIEATVQAALAG